MKRKLAFLEASLYAQGEVPNHVVATVKIRGAIDEHSVRLALAKVQSRHPLLNVCIDTDERGFLHFVGSEKILPISLEIKTRQSDDDWKAVFIPACVLPFDENSPLMRVIWLRSATVSDLMFICHHCICDGKSILNLLDEVLRVTTSSTVDLGFYDASLPLTDFIPAAVKRNKVNQLIGKTLPVLTKFAFFFASSKKITTRDQPYFIQWKLSEEISFAVLERCKKEHLSIHALLSVLYLAAFQQLKRVKRHQKLYCSVDMRKFIPEITDDMLFAFPAMVPLRGGWITVANIWEQARLLHRKLKKRLDTLDAYSPLIYTEALLPLIPKITNYAKNDRGSHAFTFSNMGRTVIKEQYRDLSVEALYSPGCIFPFGNPSTLGVTTFRGQLDFVFTSDQHFLPHQDAMIVRAKAMELLYDIIKIA